MNGNYLLDTNIVIALFAADEQVINQLKKLDNIFLPVVVLGELYFGISKSRNIDNNLNRLNDFVIKSTILSCDKETAKHYGSIKFKLKILGKPIPENDIWIAAIAKQYEQTLLTRDDHFNSVEDISIKML